MYVVKRDGRQERVMFDKITARINKLAYELDQRYIDTAAIAQKVREKNKGERAEIEEWTRTGKEGGRDEKGREGEEGSGVNEERERTDEEGSP